MLIVDCRRFVKRSRLFVQLLIVSLYVERVVLANFYGDLPRAAMRMGNPDSSKRLEIFKNNYRTALKQSFLRYPLPHRTVTACNYYFYYAHELAKCEGDAVACT